MQYQSLQKRMLLISVKWVLSMLPKEYRKQMGFTNKSKFAVHLGAKDIVEPNWSLIEKKNTRLIEIFEKLQSLLIVKDSLSIFKTVRETTEIVKENDILPRLNNHGRAVESVYYNWLQGYLTELLFTPLISKTLHCPSIVRHGGDDITNIEFFRRTGDADLVDHTTKTMIDVQAGFTNGTIDIKKHKVLQAHENKDYESFVFFADLMNGTYANIPLKPLISEEFVPNPSWEGQLCYTVSNEHFQSFVKEY